MILCSTNSLLNLPYNINVQMVLEKFPAIAVVRMKCILPLQLMWNNIQSERQPLKTNCDNLRALVSRIQQIDKDRITHQLCICRVGLLGALCFRGLRNKQENNPFPVHFQQENCVIEKLYFQNMTNMSSKKSHVKFVYHSY